MCHDTSEEVSRYCKNVILALSIVALVLGGVSAFYAWKTSRSAADSADSAKRSAWAAEESDRRARFPQIDIVRGSAATYPIDNVIYTVRNNGPQALEEIVIFRPQHRSADGIIYPLGVVGGPGYAKDEIVLGPLPLTGEGRFVLCCGGAEHLPEFRVHIQFRAGADRWESTYLLPDPRKP
jgi:hypothetical protein